MPRARSVSKMRGNDWWMQTCRLAHTGGVKPVERKDESTLEKNHKKTAQQAAGNVPREDLYSSRTRSSVSVSPLSVSLPPARRLAGSWRAWRRPRQPSSPRGWSPRRRSSAAGGVSCWATPGETMQEYSQETFILQRAGGREGGGGTTTISAAANWGISASQFNQQ